MLKIWKANEDGRRMLTDGESSNGLCQVDRKPDCLILLMLCCICNTLCVIYGFCETKYNKACPCLTIRVSSDCIDWLIDWLIVGCLASSGKYSTHIQDKIKFKNIYKMSIKSRNNRSSDFWMLLEKNRDLCRMKSLGCYSGYNVPFFDVYKRSLYRVGSVVFTTHIA
jgi:hypothetical protein